VTYKGHTLLDTALLPLPWFAYYVSSPEYFIYFAGGSLLGATLPDIDEPESYIGRRTRGVSDMIKAVLGHRGATHYLIVPLVIFIAAFLFPMEPMLKHIFFGVAFGWLAHIIGDGLTVSGVRNGYFPLKKHYATLPKALRFKTGSIVEYGVIALLIALNAYIYAEIITINELPSISDITSLLKGYMR